jgi:hypothetical protein
LPEAPFCLPPGRQAEEGRFLLFAERAVYDGLKAA